MQGITVYAAWLGIVGLVIAYLVFLYVKKQPNGTQVMQDLEGMIHSGAMAFLRKEYSVLVFFIAIVFLLLGFGISWRTGIAFVTGAFCSMVAGFLSVASSISIFRVCWYLCSAICSMVLGSSIIMNSQG